MVPSNRSSNDDESAITEQSSGLAMTLSVPRQRKPGLPPTRSARLADGMETGGKSTLSPAPSIPRPEAATPRPVRAVRFWHVALAAAAFVACVLALTQLQPAAR